MKRAYPQQAKNALEVYLKRGAEALEYLAKEQYDQAIDKLRFRDAAYHNFRALDHLALESGIDIAKDKSVSDLWKQVEAMNSKLMFDLLSHLNISAQQLNQTQAFRRDLQNYTSGTPQPTKFLKIV